MIERLYIDNYRCFVDFELRPGYINLFLGDNGSGKSTVLDILAGIGDLLAQRRGLAEVFPPGSRTRWQDRRQQKVEVDWRSEAGLYRYELVVAHEDETRKVRIEKELLFLDGQPLYTFESPVVQVYRDDHSLGSSFEIPPDFSYLAMLEARPGQARAVEFKEALEDQLALTLEPERLEAEGQGERNRMERSGRDFVSWYRSVAQERSEILADIFEDLRERIPGFVHLRLEKVSSESRRLVAVFEGTEGKHEIRFDELSTGQRALVVLYVLLHVAIGPDKVLLLDEPDNFLALPEVQPWWIALTDAVEDGGSQLLAISHNSESMNYLGPSWSSWWFEREDGGPTKVSPLEIRSEENRLKFAELVARGWVGGED